MFLVYPNAKHTIHYKQIYTIYATIFKQIY